MEHEKKEKKRTRMTINQEKRKLIKGRLKKETKKRKTELKKWIRKTKK